MKRNGPKKIGPFFDRKDPSFVLGVKGVEAYGKRIRAAGGLR